MSTLRFKSIENLNHLMEREVHLDKKLSEYFCENVFSMNTMREYLTKEAYNSIQGAIEKGTNIERNIADQIAGAMKEWALSKNVTHYTHWFQPLTGATAEKHDSFFSPVDVGKAIERFNGGMLIQQEPDASSFPNGGIRNTFEARGYTAWDPTSPAFIIGTTLCIPSVFISYTGETLDFKTPLLKALQAVDSAATDVMRSYFDRKVNKVHATLGWEQEYFLIDLAMANARPDLTLTGRTLLGHAPAKGQQLDDHYFGSIPQRVMNYMKELEVECIKLGIPVTTRHNEVAPNQFELAPMFEEANIAVDHNSLLMDIMGRIALKHKFKLILHEKPFEGVNGSGKHNNWSLQTDLGDNLLSPGKNPKRNLQFLTFFISSIKAVAEYGDLIRSAIASASNDHRLGANEAPPAIISVFIGSQLTNVLNELEKVRKGKLSPDEKTDLKLNLVGKIPEILLDNTDRNRTSPFAFTGNKFEIRAVGSTANCGEVMTVMNTIMANQLNLFKKEVDILIKQDGLKKDEAIFNVLREYVKTSKHILFEGDGYSEAWLKDAEKRGLKNLMTTPDALKNETDKKFIDVFVKNAILTEREIHARNEIKLEKYSTLIGIEAQVLADLSRNHIVPTAIRYQNQLIKNVKGLKQIFEDEYKTIGKEQIELIKTITYHIREINRLVDILLTTKEETSSIKDGMEQAYAFSTHVKPLFDDIRKHVDALEMMVDDEMWPLPKYREMMFLR
ncbi:glutamine synthetase type III [Flavobacteriaceae bacterium Ap0902]|nr:glutamine synthetase type III [Flavobacteriaceae bacterium Ap0902]